uniref:C-type lectin domain-containing protein n=1 Tax=Caenorhabditis japonica TaxID=281687 RepID=A0A8R1DG38_CAEJA
MNRLFAVLLFLVALSTVVNARRTKNSQVAPTCDLWERKCPPGWKPFIREPRIYICFRIFGIKATYLEAQEVCRKNYNSRVHGIANVEEHMWIKNKAKSLIPEESSVFWIGARRKSYCYNKQSKLEDIEECKDKKLQQFEWDDQLTTEQYLFTHWNDDVRAPNGKFSNDAPEDCAVMNVDKESGTIDDRDCSKPAEGFICGMSV